MDKGEEMKDDVTKIAGDSRKKSKIKRKNYGTKDSGNLCVMGFPSQHCPLCPLTMAFPLFSIYLIIFPI